MIDYTKSFAGTQRRGFDEGLRSYMLKVYNYMAIALALTGVTALASLYFEPLTRLIFNISPEGQIYGYSGIGLLFTIAPIGIALFFYTGIGRMQVDTARILFWVYAGLTGVSLSSLGLVYTGQSIARTFFICSSVFGAMSLYGYSTQKDLTSLASFLTMGLIGIIIASLVNLFLKSSAINFVTSFLGVGIFMGLIAYDTQRLKSVYYMGGGGEVGQKMSIVGAFGLYLNFINLFLHLIRLQGDRRN